MFFSRSIFESFSAVLASLHESAGESDGRLTTLLSALQRLFPDCAIVLTPVAPSESNRGNYRNFAPASTLSFYLEDAGQQVIVRRPEPITAREHHLAARIQEHVDRISRHERTSAAPSREPSISPAAHMPELTPREYEVLRWIMVGKRNAEIARLVGAAPRTIGKHVENILRKLEVETRGAAARIAVERLDRLRQNSCRNGPRP